MKNKLLALSLMLLMTVMAISPALSHDAYTGKAGNGFATWTTAQKKVGSYSVYLSTNGTTSNDGAKVEFQMPLSTKLSSINTVSFWYKIDSSCSEIPNLGTTWPLYLEEGQSYNLTVGGGDAYLSPYVTFGLDTNGDGTEDKWVVSQPFARDPDAGWVPAWESWDITDNAKNATFNPTVALWHDEAFTDNATTGGAGAWPAGWEPLSYFKNTWGNSPILHVKIWMGLWAVNTNQSAWVDDLTINGVVYAVEPVILYVDPPTVTKSTPAFGQTFSVSVKVDNVYDLYGFQFDLQWNTSILDCIGAVHNAAGIWGAGKFFVANDTIVESAGKYSVAITATPPAVGKSGSNVVLVTFTFKVTYDPIYGRTGATCPLDIKNEVLGDSHGKQITVEFVKDGTYTNTATQPKVKVLFSPSDTRNATFLGETFWAEVNIQDVVKLIKYTFDLDYNTTQLDVVEAQIGPFLPGPYKTSSVIINEAGGKVTFDVEGFTPVSGNGVVARVKFKVTLVSYWKTVASGKLSSTISISPTWYYVEGGWQFASGLWFAYDTLNMTQKLIKWPQFFAGNYNYKPVPGDMDASGTTNVFDLATVAKRFGWTGTPCSIKEDINADGVINVLDLIVVAINFTP